MFKQTFSFNAPLLNAAGSLGFAPDTRLALDINQLGAFITNPLSLQRRLPARPPRLAAYPGGMLLHSGHPNPGLSSALKKYGSRWARASLPIIIHLLGSAPHEMERMVTRLETRENILGIEVGLPHGIEANAASEIIAAALGELPLMVRLPLGQAVTLAPLMIAAGATLVSLGPPRGALPHDGGDASRQGSLLYGRLYGPAVFPQALETVQTLVEMEIPLVGGGGVYDSAQAEAMLAAGTQAVQLDTILWRAAHNAFTPPLKENNDD